MNELTQVKTAEEQLAEIKADRWDSMFFPSQPAFGVVERAFRRGFVHALVAIAEFAENVPPEFRAWIKANLEIYNKWRNDFRFGRTNPSSAVMVGGANFSRKISLPGRVLFSHFDVILEQSASKIME